MPTILLSIRYREVLYKVKLTTEKKIPNININIKKGRWTYLMRAQHVLITRDSSCERVGICTGPDLLFYIYNQLFFEKS